MNINIDRLTINKMTKDQLIAKQQLEIEGYKQMLDNATELKFKLIDQFFLIDDNVLKFNKNQMEWCYRLYKLLINLPESI